MIADYLNQSATLRSQDGTYTSEGQPNYTESPISVRWEANRALVRSETGTEVVSEARVFTSVAVSANDELTLDGTTYRVIRASPITGLDGTTTHWEVRL